MENNLKHMDCRNYATIDVVHGICHRTKDPVLADVDHCEHFVATQKCKFCLHFAPGDHYLGSCGATSSKPMTYPDLIAVTCADFARAEAT